MQIPIPPFLPAVPFRSRVSEGIGKNLGLPFSGKRLPSRRRAKLIWNSSGIRRLKALAVGRRQVRAAVGRAAITKVYDGFQGIESSRAVCFTILRVRVILKGGLKWLVS